MKSSLKCQVIMLPAQTRTRILKSVNTLEYIDPRSKQFLNGVCQHLYLTSDREIKKGDWVYFRSDLQKESGIYLVNNIQGEIIETKDDNPEDGYGYFSIKFSQKIEATTDPILDYFEPSAGAEMLSGKYKIPQIPDAFIQAYIKADGKIDEVGVELRGGRIRLNPDEPLSYALYREEAQEIKTRPDNTVVMIQVKKFTLDELKQYAFYAVQYASKLQAGGQKIIRKDEIDDYLDKEIY